MNVLERLQERVLNKELDGTIKNTEQLKLFVSGYMQGIYDQYHEDYFSLEDEDYKKIKEWTENYFKSRSIIPSVPMKATRSKTVNIIIKAETIREANYTRFIVRRAKELYT